MSHAQIESPKGIIFNLSDFNKKAQLADWLYKYDIVAWMTSDSIDKQDKKDLAHLGKEWFCYQDKDELWHAVYGKYVYGEFNQVFHYVVDKAGKSKIVTDKVDTTISNSYSRALITANQKVSKVKDSVHITFNQYIRLNDNKTFTVWFLPAFQKNNVVLYGGEFIYSIDPSGRKVIKDDSYYKGKFLGFKIGKPHTIMIDYSDLETPTIGAIFFVWSYKKYFTNIYIECAHSKSTAVKDENNRYTWMHTEK